MSINNKKISWVDDIVFPFSNIYFLKFSFPNSNA